jgi:hypothetical protein
LVTTIQHAAVSVVPAEGVIASMIPSSTAYDETALASAEIESLPALTANRRLRSRTRALWLPRPPPVPLPPVANAPSETSEPSGAR